MTKIGRNSPCPCGSGKKYKRCCQAKDAELREKPLPPGRFRYEPGSYGGPGGYMPSILCYQEQGPNSWVEHFGLVKPDAIFDEEDSSCEAARNDLAKARAAMDAGGSIHDFALLLRHGGYKSVSGFRVIKGGGTRESIDNCDSLRSAASLPNASNTFDSFSFNREQESKPLSEEKIEQVSRVLSEWNPLGDRAGTIPDLDGYRIEAIDILCGLNLFGSANPAATVRDILNQAFDISLPIDECRDAAIRIASIHKTK